MGEIDIGIAVRLLAILAFLVHDVPGPGACTLFIFLEFLALVFRFQPFGFILAGGALVHMRVPHGLHQFISHRKHLVAGLAQDFFFHLLELRHVHLFLKGGNFDFFFFDLFFFHHARA